MIWDCFPFFDEVDLLEIRLHELGDVVDRFVIVEATRTHSGRPRELVFPRHRGRYAKFSDRIEYIPMTTFEGIAPGDSWAMEHAQKQVGLDRVLEMARPGDLLIYGDCDEIPRAKTVEKAQDMEFSKLALHMPLYYYKLNLRADKTWKLPRMVRLNGKRLLHRQIRRRTADSVLHESGWHFSYMGDIKRKIDAFAHVEYARPPYNDPGHIAARVAAREDLFGRGLRFTVDSDLSRMPRCVQENPEKYRRMLA